MAPPCLSHSPKTCVPYFLAAISCWGPGESFTMQETQAVPRRLRPAFPEAWPLFHPLPSAPSWALCQEAPGSQVTWPDSQKHKDLPFPPWLHPDNSTEVHSAPLKISVESGSANWMPSQKGLHRVPCDSAGTEGPGKMSLCPVFCVLCSTGGCSQRRGIQETAPASNCYCLLLAVTSFQFIEGRKVSTTKRVI